MKLDSVEKMLLGFTPDAAIADDGVGLARDPRAVRVEALRKYLLEVPELRAELAKDIEVAWRGAYGRRGEFLKAFAERRAQILSLAELGRFRQQAPQTIADFHSELSRYLMETEGQPGDSLP